MRIDLVLETEEVARYLKSRDLISQYKKVKNYILMGRILSVRLKKRQPKEYNVWSFRVNKKFRAFAYLDKTALKVFHIDDHQE